MRLIDLDEIEYFTLVDKFGIPRYKVELGEGLSIVEAIPIEWIKEWRKHQWFSDKPLEERTIIAMGVRLMLEDWEKESEV